MGRDAQPVGHRPHAGRVERRVGGRGRGGPRPRRRWPPTARARSASRPRAAASSASSRSVGRVPRAPHDSDGSHWIVFGGLTRSVPDAALMLDVLGARPRRGDRSPTPPARAPGRLRVAYVRALPARHARHALARHRAARCDGTARAAARARPRGRRARHRLRRRTTLPLILGAAVPRDARLRRRVERPRAARAPHARDRPPRRADLRPGARSPARRRAPARARASRRLFDEHDVLLTPMMSRPGRPRRADGGPRRDRHVPVGDRVGAVQRAVELDRPAGGVGAGRLQRRRPPAGRPDRRAARTPRRRCSRSPRRSRRRARGPTAARRWRALRSEPPPELEALGHETPTGEAHTRR